MARPCFSWSCTMAQSTLPSSSSFTRDWTYDVFLNFRGIDTRHNFTGNLYNSLCQNGIQTFIDDEGLKKGEEIKPALLQAIKESRIFIAIFSKNYASSIYCLEELVVMLECSKAQERLLLPVFYDVEPTHVRHQTGTYAEAMAQHEKQFQDDKGKIKVQKWREALTQAANKSGWHFKDQDRTQEYEFIGNIVKEISEKIDRIPLHVADNPVGLESPVQEVISLLGIGSGEGVKMIGICGIGGIGKSTIARAVYNLIADQFEGLCFLDDIKEEATKHRLARLQEKLLSELLGDKDIKVGHVNKGIPMIKGTNAIEVIIVDLCKAKVEWSGQAFENMKNLRILIIRNGRFSIGPQNLPNSLRVLDWSGYPSQSLPLDFKPKNLAILSLHESFLKLFKPFKVFKSLCFLDFEGCKFLTQLPDLSGVPNLGAFCLDDCINLTDIHHSVGFLDKLVLLTAQRSTQLNILVSDICLTSLETLDLRGCSSLENFPEVWAVMENIRDVYLDHTAIIKLPFSIGNLVGLQRLFLRECHGLRQLPRGIHLLSKVEIIMDYGCRGFRLSEDKEKVSSEKVPKGMLIHNIGFSMTIDMFCLATNPNNFLEVYIPEPAAYSYNPYCNKEDCMVFLSQVSMELFSGRVNWYKFESKESSVKFWFQKKFPKIAFCCAGEPDMYNDNTVFMDFKLSVLINGAKQLASSCNYIFSVREVKKDIILCCNLQCKEEDAFPELDWNEAEILCELDYYSTLATKDKIAIMKIPKWSLVYVYPENQSEDVKFNNPQLPLSLFLSQEREQMANVIDGLLFFDKEIEDTSISIRKKNQLPYIFRIFPS